MSLMGKRYRKLLVRRLFLLMALLLPLLSSAESENLIPEQTEQTAPELPGQGSELPEPSEDEFFLSSFGLPLWQVCQAVSDYFGVNVIVFDDLKDKPIFADVSGCSLRDVLDSITWLLGVEWVDREGQYYIGGNQSVIKVYSSLGIDSKIEQVFPNSVKIVNDKIIVQGSEREIKRVTDSIEQVISRDVARCQVKVIEIIYNDNYQIGLDWEKSFEYGVDWKNILKNVHPVTHLAMSAKASVQLDQAVQSSRYLIDTQIGILSGSSVTLNIGDEIDRPVYSTSEYGNRVVSGYNTQKTGLIISLKAFHSGDSWVFDSSVEHSRPVSDLQKSLSKVTTQVKIDDDKPFLLANVSTVGGDTVIEQGIPFLCRLPYVGWMFGVYDKVHLRRDFYVCLKLLDDSELRPEPSADGAFGVYQSMDDFVSEFK